MEAPGAPESLSLFVLDQNPLESQILTVGKETKVVEAEKNFKKYSAWSYVTVSYCHISQHVNVTVTCHSVSVCIPRAAPPYCTNLPPPLPLSGLWTGLPACN